MNNKKKQRIVMKLYLWQMLEHNFKKIKIKFFLRQLQ